MNTFRLKWTTIALTSVTLAAATGSLVSGAETRIVSPPSAANAEGNRSATPNLNPTRIQFLIPASDFADLPESQRYIVAFNFRSDRTLTAPVDWTFPHQQMWMSTTDKENLTTVFDDNHGPDKTMVFDGAITYPFLATGPAAGPRDIADGPQLQTPFFYDPSQGNLLIEQLDFETRFPQTTLDTVRIPNRNLVLLSDGNATAASGVLLDVPPVLQFQFVPEPSSVALTSLAFICLLVCRRRK